MKLVSSNDILMGAPCTFGPTSLAATDAGLVLAWQGVGTDKLETIWTSRWDGRAWSPPESAIRAEQVAGQGSLQCWDPALLPVPSAADSPPLLLFYAIDHAAEGRSQDIRHGVVAGSFDGGATWDRPRPLPTGVFGPLRGKKFITRDGAWLFAAQGPSVQIDSTPDACRSWRRPIPLENPDGLGAIQPALVTYRDGRLQVLCRTGDGCVAQSFSEDEGKTWSPLRRSSLPNPHSGLDAVSLPDGRALLVHNHSNRGRTPLNISLSRDGTTWDAGPVLEDGPGKHSFPSVVERADGLMHVVYVSNGQPRHSVLSV